MSGKRLLDAVAVLNASRTLAAKHLALRQHQFDSYNKTSSVAKAVKSQTDRITLTFKAASALAKRFNGHDFEHVPKASRSGSTKKGSKVENATKEAEENRESGERQNGQHLSYPSQLEKSPLNARLKKDPSEFRKDQGRGSSHTSLQSNGKLSYTWPNFNSAKDPGDERDGHEHVSLDQMNQDAFSSRNTQDDEFSLASNHVDSDQKQKSEQNELSEGVYAGMFQSQRVSKMLRERPHGSKATKDSEPPQATAMSAKDPGFAHEKDEAISNDPKPRHDRQASYSLPEHSDSALSRSRGYEDARTVETDFPNSSTRVGNAPIKAAYEMRESKVPSSRLGRIWQYGGLATSMAFGAVGESFRRAAGSGGESGGSLILSEANMERLVAKLSRMRGAALKLGQMMSFQESKMLPKPIHDVLQRVQDSADYMPASQRNHVLSSNLGTDWRSLFTTFDENPIAAASIGQVHRATLASTSQPVAVKIQYPGVASSIDSDLSNLAILLTASRLLPKGLYLDKTIANARVELAWECDYIREAEMGKRFRELLADQVDIYHVPAIIKEASGPQVLTAEFVEGTGVTKGQHFTQEQKDWIGTNVLRLCLREITEFKFMQTDPNWTNFLFNQTTQKLELLDFGASREFPDKFIVPYIRTLLAASEGDRDQVRDLSIKLGYLTGHESNAMTNAHVNSVLTLAEPFADKAPTLYDFRDQTITDRVRGFIPTMLRERLAPPPEETYSIHRKLSGAFLLCARLGSRVRCRELFETAMGRAGVS